MIENVPIEYGPFGDLLFVAPTIPSIEITVGIPVVPENLHVDAEAIKVRSGGQMITGAEYLLLALMLMV